MTRQLTGRRVTLFRAVVAGLGAALALLVLPAQAHAQNGRWLREDHEIVLGYGCTPFELEPFDGRFNCPQGWRVHEAIDFDTPEATRVYAGLPGTVLNVGGPEAKDYGPNYVRMQLPDGHDLILGHLSTASVRAGDSLAQGQLIGLTGTLGVTNWPNLHFEVRPHDGTTYTSINPAPYLTLSSAAPTAAMAKPSATDNDQATASQPGQAAGRQAAPGPFAPVTTDTGDDPLAVVASLTPLAALAPDGAAAVLLVAFIQRRRRERAYGLYLR